MNRILTYQYVSAPAGSGKTHSAIRHAVDIGRTGDKVIIAQPTIDCITEWHPKTCEYADKFSGNPVSVLRFDQQECGEGKTLSAIHQHLETSKDGGEVIFITHAALLFIRDWYKPERWHLIVDEIPDPTRFFAKHLPENHNFITDAIHWEDFSATCYEVVPKDAAPLLRYARNESKDDVDKEFQEIAQSILNPHAKVLAARENLHRTIGGDTQHGKFPLYLFSILQPSIFESFKSTTIMGAGFEESLLYLLWSAKQVDFQEHSKLSASLRYQVHPNGNRLEIYYLADDHWSQNLSKKKQELDGHSVTNNQIALDAVLQAFGDDPFTYLVNKNTAEEARALFKGSKTKPLPYSPFGLNGYVEYDNVAVIAAFLPPPYHYRFLDDFGINADDVRNAIHNQITYQAITRTSLRDLSKSSTVKVLVTDKHMAEWLADQFEGSAIGAVGEVPMVPKNKGGRPKKHDTAKARVNAFRQRARDEKEEADLAQLIPEIQKGQVSVKRNPIYLYSGIVTSKPYLFSDPEMTEPFIDLDLLSYETWIGSLFRHKWDKNTDRQMFAASTDQVVEWLEHCYRLSYPSKTDNWLISPALFNPALGDSSRGLENVIVARGIWLDIDDGDLTYQDFQKMFPGYRMVTYNTASSIDDTRFRVYMPTSGYMMVDTYNSICRQIVKKVQSNGYCSPRQKKTGSKKPCHGIDLSKMNAANLMFLPSQPLAGGKAFFEHYDGQELNPDLWVQNNILPVEFTPVYEPITTSMDDFRFAMNDNEQDPQVLLKPYAASVLKGSADQLSICSRDRNNMLYAKTATCFKYVQAGLLDAMEVKSQLETAAKMSGLGDAEIKATMKSAEKRGRSAPLNVDALFEKLVRKKVA